MTLTIALSFIVTFVIAAVFVPVIGEITKKMGIIAHTNERTIHKGIIPRTGGYGIYVAFLIGAMLFLKTDTQINSILIGGFIIFLVGFYDDIHDLPPKAKMAGQILAALVVIFYGGISLKNMTLPFLPENVSSVIAVIITIGWIIGITNAINLIDGLDGLCAGISIIVLFTISMTSISFGRSDIAALSMLVAGATAGFLLHNFHPAKIFMGDCGALFIGFMIAVISLLGFGYKSSIFFTLGAPIVVLMVPIMDTIIAIIRRKVHHKRFDEADKGHLHHKLMISLELGQTKSVLILYAATAMFSLCSYLYNDHRRTAACLFILLLMIFELFVEATNMISRKYKPLLTIVNIFLKSDKLPKIKDSEAYVLYMRHVHAKVKYVVIVLLVAAIAVVGYNVHNNRHRRAGQTTIVYPEARETTKLLTKIHKSIHNASAPGEEDTLRESVAAYFAADFYTLTNKEENEIGGMDFCLDDIRDSLETYAESDYYKTVNDLLAARQATSEVTAYDITGDETSDAVLIGLENYEYYTISMTLTFNEVNVILDEKTIDVTVTLIHKDRRYSVVAYNLDS